MANDDQNLRRVFGELFTVKEIAQPLASFDNATKCEDVLPILKAKAWQVAGVRSEGIVSGYVELTDLECGTCGERARPIDPKSIVVDSLPLAPVVLLLIEFPRVFVTTLGQIGGLVTRHDLQKAPARMWLFGMITLIELRFSRLIEQACPNESWKTYLSDGRFQKAQELQALRRTRHQQVSLSDCLQFADKTQIIARHEDLRKRTRFQEKRDIEKIGKRLENLRNSLAHAQDIVSNDWETIVALAEQIDSVLRGPADGPEPHTPHAE